VLAISGWPEILFGRIWWQTGVNIKTSRTAIAHLHTGCSNNTLTAQAALLLCSLPQLGGVLLSQPAQNHMTQRFLILINDSQAAAHCALHFDKLHCSTTHLRRSPSTRFDATPSMDSL
jgi:hypothetical protein